MFLLPPFLEGVVGGGIVSLKKENMKIQNAFSCKVHGDNIISPVTVS